MLAFIYREKFPPPVDKSTILLLSPSPSASVKVSRYYSVHFMEKRRVGTRERREQREQMHWFRER